MTCPRCNRDITVDCGRFKRHATTYRGTVLCRMSEQLAPITGHAPTDYLRRAHLVADLAMQIQDQDPSQVWDYATGLDAGELQRLFVIALAAFPTDKTMDEAFGWVCGLPVARLETA